MGAAVLAGGRRIAAAIAAGPLAAVTAHGVGYVLNSAVCGDPSRWASLAVIAVALLAVASSTFWLLRAWQQRRHVPRATRSESLPFVIEFGLASSAFFLVVTIAYAITPMAVDGCR